MKKILFISLCLFFVSSVQAGTTFCTTKNWDKVARYYKKNENSLNESMDKLNVEIDEKKGFDFFYPSYTVENIANLWAAKNNKVSTALNYQHKIASEKVDDMTELRGEFATLMRRFKKAKANWKKIGVSCEDDGEWGNGRQAAKNEDNAEKALQSTLGSIKKVERMRVAYRKDKKLIVSGYTEYKKIYGIKDKKEGKSE